MGQKKAFKIPLSSGGKETLLWESAFVTEEMDVHRLSDLTAIMGLNTWGSSCQQRAL